MTALAECWGIKAGVSVPAYNPLTAIGWHTAFWAEDPAQTNPGDGNAVSTWRDGSGNGHTLNQATGTKQPLYRADGGALLNHKPAIEFDGVDDYLGTSSFTSVAQTYTGVWIGRRLGSGGGNAEDMIAFVNGVSPFVSMFMMVGSGGPAGTQTHWDMYGGSTHLPSSLTYNTTAAHAIRAKFAGASSEINVDGTNTAAPPNPGTGAATFFILAGSSLADGNNANQQTAFAALYSGDVTGAAGWSTFVSWVNTNYGLTIA